MNAPLEFYWKNIDIENYNNIIHEMRNNMNYRLLNDNKAGLYHYDLDKFYQNCTLFTNWVRNKSLTIKRIAIIKMLPGRKQDIHRDFLEDPNNTYGLNLNLHNCVNNYTQMFDLIDINLTTPVSYGPNGKPFYSYIESQCKEVTRYNLEKPVLLDLNKLHRVVNLTEDIRLSVSFRFMSKPEL